MIVLGFLHWILRPVWGSGALHYPQREKAGGLHKAQLSNVQPSAYLSLLTGLFLGVSCSCLELELGLGAPVSLHCSPELGLSLGERIYNLHRQGLIEGDLTQQGTSSVTGN